MYVQNPFPCTRRTPHRVWGVRAWSGTFCTACTKSRVHRYLVVFAGVFGSMYTLHTVTCAMCSYTIKEVACAGIPGIFRTFSVA
jgi:hypothetical protein